MYKELQESLYPTGNYLVIRNPSSIDAISVHRIDDPIFEDNNRESVQYRGSTKVPFSLFCNIDTEEILVDCIARFEVLEEARNYCLHLSTPRSDSPPLPTQSAALSLEIPETPSPLSSERNDFDKVVKFLERILDGQSRIADEIAILSSRLTNIEGAVSLCNERISAASKEMSEMKAASVATTETVILRKPLNPGDPPMAISLVPFLQLQEQIAVFIDSAEGQALNVCLNGKCFRMDARLVKAAALVQHPRQFGIMIFQLVLDISVLVNYSVGYLQTGRIAGASKRQKGGPKKQFSTEFNRFLGNLCMLCGGCVVHESSLRVWYMEIRESLNSRGDNLFAGSTKKKPDLGHMRAGEDHQPMFSDPSAFMAPPAKKRRFVVDEEEVIDLDTGGEEGEAVG